MPTKRISDLPVSKPCSDPDHKPAQMVMRQPGIYEHTCPRCGQTFTFVVPNNAQWLVATGKKKSGILTPLGSIWNIDQQDIELAEWACDILNAGEIK